MRIKSKDIHFVQYIFYFANIKTIDISFLYLRYYSLGQKLFKCLVYFLALEIKKSLQVPHLQAHDELVKLRFSNFNQLSTS